ncbi:MAG: 3-dehydroquinate synthase [Oligoflexales bacterium]|nr:3-dehydroquinate synthase [Oligoflexales bacterium]
MNGKDLSSWEDLIGKSNPEEQKIEKALGWPQASLKVLKRAFDLNFDRQTPWRLESHASPELREAVKIAASFYKRGVPLLDLSEAVPGSKTLIEAAPGENISFSALSDQVFSEQTLFILDGTLLACNQTLQNFVESLLKGNHGRSSFYVIQKPDEHKKNLEELSQIILHWRSRDSFCQTLCGVGGGICCDLVSMAAAVLNVSFSLVPTTLLSMVDASIGGKAAVNIPPYGKNQIGAFSFSREIYIDPSWLVTLAPREFRSGLGECFKHALLTQDRGLLPDVLTLCSCFRESKTKGDCIDKGLLRRLIAVKSVIVQQDPFEKNLRATLNLGHTLAHALEAVSMANIRGEEEVIRHGEAVTVGLLFSLMLSFRMGFLQKDSFDFCLASLKASNLLLTATELTHALGYSLLDPRLWQDIFLYMKQDKKNKTGTEDLRMVLLRDLGQCVCSESGSYLIPVTEEQAFRVWEDLISFYKVAKDFEKVIVLGRGPLRV